jgi:hypothetical protein
MVQAILLHDKNSRRVRTVAAVVSGSISVAVMVLLSSRDYDEPVVELNVGGKVYATVSPHPQVSI